MIEYVGKLIKKKIKDDFPQNWSLKSWKQENVILCNLFPVNHCYLHEFVTQTLK